MGLTRFIADICKQFAEPETFFPYRTFFVETQTMRNREKFSNNEEDKNACAAARTKLKYGC